MKNIKTESTFQETFERLKNKQSKYNKIATAAACVSLSSAGFALGSMVQKSVGVETVEPIGNSQSCKSLCFPFDVARVTDGDTVRGVATLGLGVSHRVKVRLFGIDTPETRGVKDKAPGEAAKAFSVDWLDKRRGNLTLCVEEKKRDKYGRTLGDVCGFDACLADELLGAGHARAYDGGKK